ncbi:unnamed protein product [Closterium sp. NIES-54]
MIRAADTGRSGAMSVPMESPASPFHMVAQAFPVYNAHDHGHVFVHVPGAASSAANSAGSSSSSSSSRNDNSSSIPTNSPDALAPTAAPHTGIDPSAPQSFEPDSLDALTKPHGFFIAAYSFHTLRLAPNFDQLKALPLRTFLVDVTNESSPALLFGPEGTEGMTGKQVGVWAAVAHKRRVVQYQGRVQYPMWFGDPSRNFVLVCEPEANAKPSPPFVWMVVSFIILAISVLVLWMSVHLMAKLETDTLRVESAQAQLATAKVAAEAASRAKSDFLTTMSHEIRTPMNGVIGMLNLLMETPLDGTQQDYAETACSSGRALCALINDILDLSKIEAEKLHLERIPLNLRAELDDVLSLFVESAEEKRSVELAAFVADDVPETLVGDPLRIRQILMNLIGNAFKFTSTGHIFLVIRLALADDTFHSLASSASSSLHHYRQHQHHLQHHSHQQQQHHHSHSHHGYHRSHNSDPDRHWKSMLEELSVSFHHHSHHHHSHHHRRHASKEEDKSGKAAPRAPEEVPAAAAALTLSGRPAVHTWCSWEAMGGTVDLSTVGTGTITTSIGTWTGSGTGTGTSTGSGTAYHSCQQHGMPNHTCSSNAQTYPVCAGTFETSQKPLQGAAEISPAYPVCAGQAVRLLVAVEDTGEGIPIGAQRCMFRPYSQAHASTTRLHGGTGIGLSICKRLVSLMGGSIAFTSEPGVGTTFYFDITLHTPPTDTPSTPPPCCPLPFPPSSAHSCPAPCPPPPPLAPSMPMLPRTISPAASGPSFTPAAPAAACSAAAGGAGGTVAGSEMGVCVVSGGGGGRAAEGWEGVLVVSVDDRPVRHAVTLSLLRRLGICTLPCPSFHLLPHLLAQHHYGLPPAAAAARESDVASTAAPTGAPAAAAAAAAAAAGGGGGVAASVTAAGATKRKKTFSLGRGGTPEDSPSFSLVPPLPRAEASPDSMSISLIPLLPTSKKTRSQPLEAPQKKTRSQSLIPLLPDSKKTRSQPLLRFAPHHWRHRSSTAALDPPTAHHRTATHPPSLIPSLLAAQPPASSSLPPAPTATSALAPSPSIPPAPTAPTASAAAIPSAAGPSPTAASSSSMPPRLASLPRSISASAATAPPSAATTALRAAAWASATCLSPSIAPPGSSSLGASPAKKACVPRSLSASPCSADVGPAADAALTAVLRGASGLEDSPSAGLVRNPICRFFADHPQEQQQQQHQKQSHHHQQQQKHCSHPSLLPSYPSPPPLQPSSSLDLSSNPAHHSKHLPPTSSLARTSSLSTKKERLHASTSSFSPSLSCTPSLSHNDLPSLRKAFQKQAERAYAEGACSPSLSLDPPSSPALSLDPPSGPLVCTFDRLPEPPLGTQSLPSYPPRVPSLSSLHAPSLSPTPASSLHVCNPTGTGSAASKHARASLHGASNFGCATRDGVVVEGWQSMHSMQSTQSMRPRHSRQSSLMRTVSGKVVSVSMEGPRIESKASLLLQCLAEAQVQHQQQQQMGEEEEEEEPQQEIEAEQQKQEQQQEEQQQQQQKHEQQEQQPQRVVPRSRVVAVVVEEEMMNRCRLHVDQLLALVSPHLSPLEQQQRQQQEEEEEERQQQQQVSGEQHHEQWQQRRQTQGDIPASTANNSNNSSNHNHISNYNHSTPACSRTASSSSETQVVSRFGAPATPAASPSPVTTVPYLLSLGFDAVVRKPLRRNTVAAALLPLFLPHPPESGQLHSPHVSSHGFDADPGRGLEMDSAYSSEPQKLRGLQVEFGVCDYMEVDAGTRREQRKGRACEITPASPHLTSSASSHLKTPHFTSSASSRLKTPHLTSSAAAAAAAADSSAASGSRNSGGVTDVAVVAAPPASVPLPAAAAAAAAAAATPLPPPPTAAATPTAAAQDPATVGEGQGMLEPTQEPATVGERLSVLWGRRVMVVDDNLINRKVASKLLERHGAQVTAVDGGAKALVALAPPHPYDLVFMDLQMPGMDGLEATRRIRARERAQGGGHVAIIALTADVIAGTRHHCFAVGMDDYLSKPLHDAPLSHAVWRCLVANT